MLFHDRVLSFWNWGVSVSAMHWGQFRKGAHKTGLTRKSTGEELCSSKRVGTISEVRPSIGGRANIWLSGYPSKGHNRQKNRDFLQKTANFRSYRLQKQSGWVYSGNVLPTGEEYWIIPGQTQRRESMRTFSNATKTLRWN